MKKLSFPLHVQIIIALILGAVFGVVFSVDQHYILLTQLDGIEEKSIEIRNWNSFEFEIPETINGEKQIKTSKFSSNDQLQILKFYNNLSNDNKKITKIIVINEQNVKLEYSNIINLEKVATPATVIKPIGTIFVRLLSFLAIPLVISSLIAGAASLDDIKKLGRIGIKTFSFYIITTVFAITIGLVIANIIQPGDRINPESKNRLLGEYQAESSAKAVESLDIDIIDFIVNIVPKNPFQAIAAGDMLQIVFFAVIFGVTLTFIDKKRSEVVINFFNGVSDTMIRMVEFIMKIAPFGVFALIAAIIAEFGFNIITTLIWYIAAVVIGLTIQTILVYPIIVKVWGRTNPLRFFKAIRNAIAIAFSTSSSAATLPVTMECCEKNLGIPKQITSFVLPLGATINMDGTALYQGVAAMFIAQVYGFDLNLSQQLTIVFTATLASIGTAPVPGVGIIMLVMILQAVHIPPEGIALILGVDRILDMCRTIPNITGDSAVATAIYGGEIQRISKMKI